MDAQHWNMVLKPYDQSWREDRRMFSSQMNSNASAQFAGVQTRQARLLLKRLTNFSVNISDYIRGCALSLWFMTPFAYMTQSRRWSSD